MIINIQGHDILSSSIIHIGPVKVSKKSTDAKPLFEFNVALSSGKELVFITEYRGGKTYHIDLESRATLIRKVKQTVYEKCLKEREELVKIWKNES